MSERFRDHGRTLAAFDGIYLVECPRCQACARSEGLPWNESQPPPKVTCGSCGFNQRGSSATWHGDWSAHVSFYCPHCSTRHERRFRGCRGLDRMTFRCSSCDMEITKKLWWHRCGPSVPHDPHFGLPLWLVAPVRGRTLWAFNYEHLAFLKDFVAATLRERDANVNRSQASRLPNWLTARANREIVLTAIQRLETKG